MQDFYLKFDTEADAKSVLYTVTPAVLDEDGNVLTDEVVKPNYANIDVLGAIYEPQTDPESELVALPGWHVNVRVVAGEDAAPLALFKVEPKLPRRVWG